MSFLLGMVAGAFVTLVVVIIRGAMKQATRSMSEYLGDDTQGTRENPRAETEGAPKDKLATDSPGQVED